MLNHIKRHAIVLQITLAIASILTVTSLTVTSYKGAIELTLPITVIMIGMMAIACLFIGISLLRKSKYDDLFRTIGIFCGTYPVALSINVTEQYNYVSTPIATFILTSTMMFICNLVFRNAVRKVTPSH